MSEFSVSCKKTDHFPSLVLSDFFLFCSFIIYHPLYFFYFVFFSPYFFKLLSFLSPLFVTTALLLVALLTRSPDLGFDKSHCEPSTDSKFGFLVRTYRTIVERLKSSKVDDGNQEFHDLEDLYVYKFVFETSSLDTAEAPVVEVLKFQAKENCLTSSEAHIDKSTSHEGCRLGRVFEEEDGNFDDVNPVFATNHSPLISEAKTLKAFLHEKEELEHCWSEKSESEIKPHSVKSNKVEEEEEEEEEERKVPFTRRGSKAMGHQKSELSANGDDDVDHQYTPNLYSQRLEKANFRSGHYNIKVTETCQTLGSDLGSFGSTRKEKEWRRTLACKLFEERHNVVEGGEGMDLLWETYETDSIKLKPKSKSKKGKKGNIDHEEEDEEEEEENDGQLCCLQALKFSAGKMNLGMGRPNLMKISKALKGIGWLHHVGRHGKRN
ncbi:hypothetical protein K2173_018873 [Erythroxylum novogranatense]|uniref:Uncharacterized protein n=1 Tax=Erythroxylum novogranatense TaxID=1862640 RepID=A0AAV8SB33_9ROSI|nr:hypothetical protein K2173_018873 [Erythroxylum novogranatense]